MTIHTNYNDSIKATDGEVETTIGYLNGTLNDDKSFSLTSTVKDYDLYSANKDSVKAQIQKFTDDVMNNIDSNFKAVTVEKTSTETDSTESGVK